MMEWIANNGIYIIGIAVITLILIYGIMTNKVKEWLKYAVTLAEKELGTGTGQIKLREVYDWLLSTFPVFGRLIPFPIFSKMVDESLEWMRKQIESNNNIASFVIEER